MKSILFLFLSLFLLISCNSNTITKKPDNLISKDKMVNVLVDTYISKTARNIKNVNGNSKINYYGLIYKIHRIDSISFHESLRYYTSDIKQNEEILKAVKEKIDKKRELLKKENSKKDSL